MKKGNYQFLIVGCMVILTGIYIREQACVITKDGIMKQLSQQILDATEACYMPIVKYSFRDNEYVVEDEETYRLLSMLQENDEVVEDNIEKNTENSTKIDLDKLKNTEYLLSKYYTVDSVTYVKESDFNVEKMLNKNLKITKGDGPKILIFHTHSQEKFADSGKKDGFSIVDAGTYLAELLEDNYGIETMHHKGIYDKINGKLDRSQAYERARPEIMNILKENPSIEVVIDLHRDGVGKNTRLVTEINGNDTAQIMFFNGMCRTRTNGDLTGMSNPYLQTNLAFSLQMKITAEKYFPGFTRRNYLKGYKYNMDLAPKMLLIEAGAQTNTVEEIKNAMKPLAEILHLVVGY